jgi:hypothetical protein
MSFRMTRLSPEEQKLCDEVREFLDERLPRGSYMPGPGINKLKDEAFSRELAARGWLGMAMPKKYGGHDRSAVDRFIVAEELIRRGAPVGHHWVAERQSAPMLLRYGTEEQKEYFIPKICAGEMSFAIGMSEPDSGSDLASVRTKAVRTEGGWLLTGRKIWTTQAHVHDWMVVLCRTTPISETGDKRKGLSRLLVDLKNSGLVAKPIPFIDGTAEFCEVIFDEVFVPDCQVVGSIGDGWSQNTAELAFERSGPERWASAYPLVEELIHRYEGRTPPFEIASLIGSAAAHFWVFHNLSLAIARLIDVGRTPAHEAALVKEMGTRYEQDVLNAVLAVIDFEPTSLDKSLLNYLVVKTMLNGPSFTVRGGTTEILRSVAAKGLVQKRGAE